MGLAIDSKRIMNNLLLNFSFLPEFEVKKILSLKQIMIYLSNLQFTSMEHFILSVITFVVAVLISIKFLRYYLDNKDKRMLIISAGFFIGSIFEILHFTSHSSYNIQFFYIFFENLSYTGSILISLLYTNDRSSRKKYFIVALCYLLFVLFLRYYISADIITKSISYSTIEIIFAALYFLFALIYFDIRQNYKLKPVSIAIIGFLLLFSSELFILTPNYLYSAIRLFLHIQKIAGLFFIYLGINDLRLNKEPLNNRIKLLIFSALTLLSSYWIIIMGGLILFNVKFPIFFKYYFLSFFIVTIIALYTLSIKLVDKVLQPFKSIKTTFIMATLVLITSILILQSFLSLFSFKNYTEKENQKHIKSLIECESNKLYNKIINVEIINQITANAIKSFNIKSLEPVMIGNIKQHEFIFGNGVWLQPYMYKRNQKYYGPYWFKDRDNKIKFTWIYSTPNYNYLNQEWYKNGLIPGIKTAWSEPFLDPVTNIPMMTVATPIFKKNKLIGITSIDVSLESFQDYVSKIKVGQNGYAFIVSNKGVYISNRDQTKIFKEKITDDKNGAIRSLGKKIINANKTKLFITEIEQQNYLFICTSIGDTKLKMVFVLPESESFSHFNKILALNILLFFLTFISFSIIFTWIFRNSIGRPLDNMVKTVENVAKGNLTVRATTESQDEIGLFANSLNYMIESLDNLVNKEKLQNEIISTIRSSLNINKVKKKIVANIGKAVNADKCFIIEFDQNSKKFLPIEHEYLANLDIKSNLGLDIESLAPELAKSAKVINILNISSRDRFIEENNLDSTSSASYLINTNMESALIVRLSYASMFFGILVVDFTSKTNPLRKNEIEFIKSLATQMGIALYQSKLFENSKIQADREALVRRITEVIRSSLDINKVLDIICEEIAKLLNVQRVSITRFTNPDNNTEFVTEREYIISNNIKGLINSEYDKRAPAYFIENLVHKEVFIVDNIDEFDGPDYFTNIYKFFGIKSLIGVPIKKDNNNNTEMLLILSEYNYPRKWTNDEINLIKTMSNQIHIALEHAELYSKLAKHAEREALLRKIIETIRGSLDINETLEIICGEVAQLFNVNRVSIGEFLDKKNNKEWTLKREYKSNSNIKGSSEFEFDLDSKKYLNENISNNKIFDVNNILKSDFPVYLRNLYGTAGIKSFITAAIRKDDYVWGALILADYENFRQWTGDEKELLLTITNQIYIAIEQAELYSKTKKQAEREALLRNLSNNISQSMDINTIKNSIITEVGKIFGADRVAIIEYCEENNELILDENFAEYLSSDCVQSLKSVFTKLDTVTYSINKIKNAESIIFKDYEEYIEENNLKNTVVERNLIELGIKSCICVPIFNYDKYFGTLLVHFTREKSNFNNNDIEFIRTLAKQTGIALHQSILFENLRSTIKYEKALAKIISTIKSNLNIDEVMMIICSELLNLFNIKKVCIQEFNQLTRTVTVYKTTDQNHKESCSPDYDKLTKDFLFKVLIEQGANLIIEDVNNSNLPNPEFYLDKGILSIMATPLKIANNVWGALFLFDNKKRILKTQEINFIKTIADYISLAIKNIYLYTQEEFLANVSHELKTPIAIINGYTDVLMDRDKEKSEMAKKFLPIIKNNTDRINAIVENVLYLSKLSKSQESLNKDFEKIELKRVIEEVIKNLEEKAKEKFIGINFNYNGPLYANINGFLIYQAITNLLINAINYSESNTTITINAYRENNVCKIEIQDQGCGIQEEHLPYIFERFYRVDKSRNRETGGTGLGLSIVKNILDIHSGQILANSEYSKGSTFTIVLNYQE